MIKSKKYSLLIHFAIMLFGIAGLYAKILDLPSIVIVWGRVIFAAAVLYFFTQKSNRLNLNKSFYLKLFLVGLILVIHWITFFESIKVSTVGIGLISFSTFPLFVIFYSVVFEKTKLKLSDSASVLLILAGVYLIIPDYNFQNNVFLGVLYGLFSAISFAVLTVLNKKLVKDFDSSLLAYYQYLSASVILTPILFFIDFNFQISDLLHLIMLGAVLTALGHSLFIKSLEVISAKKVSIITCLEPVYGIIFALFLLGEIPDLRVIAGGSIIILTVIFITIKEN